VAYPGRIGTGVRPGDAFSGPARSHRLPGVLLLVPLLLTSLLASAASGQAATFSIAIGIQGPSLVTVGETNRQGSLGLTNNSTGLGPVTLTSITYHPSCGDFSLACTSPEPGVFSLANSAGGAAGTACADRAFTVSSDANGRYTFTTSPPIVLATGASCTVNFGFNVLRAPTIDSQPATPGAQTTRSAIVNGTATATAGGTVNGTSRSVSTISVARAQATITTQVTASSVVLGGNVSDKATVTGVAGVQPTGTVTFNLYGPNNGTCSGPPVFTSTVPLTGSTATSAQFAPSSPGTYNWIASYSGDANYVTVSGVCNDPNETVTVLPGGRYEPLTPTRILDTRDGTGGVFGPVGPGSTVNVQITGRGGVPASGVTAVAMNVTVTQPTGDGFLTLYPTGSGRPLAANLNFTPGKTVPNMVVVRIGTGGKVDLFNSAGSTHVIYDVAGYFTDTPTGNDGRYQPLSPVRILDTRSGLGGAAVRLGPGASLDLQVAGAGGVPATNAEAVVMNVAVTNTTATSFLTVHPTGEARPLAAGLNWNAGDTVSNRVFAKLGTNGRVTLYNNGGQTDVIVDVNGWFTNPTVAGTGGTYSGLNPARVLDTRDGTGGAGTRPAGSLTDVQLTGRGGIPVSGVSAVILNATVVGPAGPGFLTIFPAGTAQPLASDVNYTTGEVRPNLVVVKVGNGGKVSLFTSSTTHVVFDVAGFFT